MAVSGNRMSLGIDWSVVALYAALVLIGLVNIYAAVYDEASAAFFDMSRNSGKQVMWIGVSLFIAVSILLIDAKYYHILAYPFYWISIIALLGVFVLGMEVKGAHSWYEFGGVRIQPTEFVKFTVSLALARTMSAYSFNIHSPRSLLNILFILALPMAIILLQNDTGSALVCGAFALMLFREGLSSWVYIVMFTLVTLFVLYFLVDPLPLVIILFALCLVGEGLANGYWRAKIIFACGVALAAAGIYFGFRLFGRPVSLYVALVSAMAVSLIPALAYAFRRRLRNVVLFILLFFGSLGFTNAIDYIFDSVLQQHQRNRILITLGIESDPTDIGYNVNQSKIAIGSGGFSGKGFLQGTQTKYDFVPEQSTDFIFCTVGEEWGFVGSAVVILLYAMLIFKLIAMGERQEETFSRVYCYCVASVFFFHFLVNIGMTIGLVPVIGIPLPFLSYGGSSMIAFTVMLFVAVKMDGSRKSHITRI